MRYRLFVLTILTVLVGVWGAGCAADDTGTIAIGESPVPGTPTAELQPTTSVPTPSAKPTVDLVPPEAQDVVALAREDLAERLEVDRETIEVIAVEAVEWSDASLGCPEPGQMYAQVVTPGFRVVLETGGERHLYHTNTGRSLAFCEGENPSGETSAKGPDASVQDGWPNQPIQGDQVGPRTSP